MLIAGTGGNTERQTAAVQFDRRHTGSQTERWVEVESATRAGALYVERQESRRSLVAQRYRGRAHAQVVQRERSPIWGNMRSERHRMALSIAPKAEHPPQNWAEHHGRRPDLVRRASRERLVVVAGEHLGDVTERSIECEQGVGPQISVGGERLVVAILANRGPSGKERPHGAEVVSAAVIDGGAVRNDPCAPVGLEVGIRELSDGGLGLVFVGDAEPQGDSGQNREFVDAAILLVEGEGKRFFLRRPETLIEDGLLAIKSGLQIFPHVVLAGEFCEIGERAQSFEAEAALVELRLHWKKRAAFDPTVAESEVLGKVLRVVGGTHELIRLPQAVPFLAGKVEVAAARDVIVCRDEVERRGVGRGVAIGIVLEPIYETCALRDFVRNLAVVALELGNELESGTSGGKVADGVERERCPERIAAEEPGKAGTLAGARRSVSGDQPCTEVGIGN